MTTQVLSIRSIRYLAPFLISGVTIFAYHQTDFLSFSTAFFAYILVPILDALLPAHTYNLTPEEEEEEEEEEQVNNDPFFDWYLYAIPLVQLFTVLFLMRTIALHFDQVSWLTVLGWIVSSATATTAYAAVSAHELGHRETWYEQLLGNISDLTMLCFWVMNPRVRAVRAQFGPPL